MAHTAIAPFSPVMDLGEGVAIGMVKGMLSRKVYGERTLTVVDTEFDLSQLDDNIIPLPDLVSGTACEVVSDSAADTGDFIIEALGPGAVRLLPITVTLAGITPVSLPENISRVNSMFTNDPAGIMGTVDLRSIAAPTTIYSRVTQPRQRSNQCIYTVPADNRGTIDLLVGSIQRSGGTTVEADLRLRGKPANFVQWQNLFSFGLQSSGTTIADFLNNRPEGFIGPYDLKLTGESSSTQSTLAGLFGGLDIAG